jgi:hypothetical protein
MISYSTVHWTISLALRWRWKKTDEHLGPLRITTWQFGPIYVAHARSNLP